MVYNTIIHSATGHPRCIPIPVLFAAAGAVPLLIRFKYLLRAFLIKHITLKDLSPLYSLLWHPDSICYDNWHWTNRLIDVEVIQFFKDSGIYKGDFINCTPIELIHNYSIITEKLGFQDFQGDLQMTKALFNFYYEQLQSIISIGTDGSNTDHSGRCGIVPFDL